jgi:colanic acid/amylovoran biosynthesis protein
MIFEVRHVGFKNKGSTLMLQAILQQIWKWNDSHIVCADLKTGSFSKRSELGMHNLLYAEYKKFPQFGKYFPQLSSMIPGDIRRKLRCILTSEVETIFDASGFSYGDQWGNTFIDDLRKYTKKCRLEGKKTIFLPQAFGPFEDPENYQNMKKVIEYSDLIYARDNKSFSYLQDLVGGSSKIKISPDFTNLVDAIPTAVKSPNFKKNVCIVPNARMIDKTEASTKESYLKFLQSSCEYLSRKDYEIKIIIHETGDLLLGNELISNLEFSAKIIQENDPRIIKGVIGRSSLLIGSRYHALVSSLSQGIPTIGTSWSHKYEALFDDYNCKEYLVPDINKRLDIETLFDPLIEEPSRSAFIERLLESSDHQKNLSNKMWIEINDFLFEN